MKDKKTLAGYAVIALAGIISAIIYDKLILGAIADYAGKFCLSFKHFLSSIPFPHASTGGLITALLTGDRKGVDRQIIECFRRSGASHILALSGFHLGFIYMLIRSATIPLGNYPAIRAFRYLAICFLCIFYTLMTGASPSAVRAMLFIIIRETVILFPERHTDNLRMFVTAMAIQVCANPSVIKSIGFQLSYSAVLGIFLFYGSLRNFFPEGRSISPMKKIWDNMALTLSCQIFTAPLCWFYFRSFPQFFLLTNLLALPLTSCIIFLAVLTAVLSLSGICPIILIKACDFSAQALIYLLENISSLQPD